MTHPPQAPSVNAVAFRCGEICFGNRLVVNNLRSIVVEAMVDEMLPHWRWCAHDWGGWDFEHLDGCRLEVKQAAALQTWQSQRPTRTAYDIRARTGYHDRSGKWVKQVGRYAHIYLFAYHPCLNETADHRNAQQWEFYLIPTVKLPLSNAISLIQIRNAANAFGVMDLPGRVHELHSRLNISGAIGPVQSA